jgi:RNA polymerase sigma-70 factor (sigma-E family)
VVTAATRQDALTELYLRHYAPTVRLAVLLTGDQQTAEDVVQDAFAAMYLAWDRLRSPHAALRAAVVNKSRSVLRHRVVVDKNMQQAPPDMPSAEHGAMIQIELSAVLAALGTLPRRQREAVILRYYADLPKAETAAAMGIRPGSVKSHAHRGMAALRRELKRQGWGTAVNQEPARNKHGLEVWESTHVGDELRPEILDIP